MFTHTHVYIYIYIYTNFVEYNRHFLSTYFLVDPFILPYWFYYIRREFIHVFSIIVYFPSTFPPTLGHHHWRIYYKSDVTFVCTLLLCKKKRVWAIAVYIYIYIYIYILFGPIKPEWGIIPSGQKIIQLEIWRGKWINRHVYKFWILKF